MCEGGKFVVVISRVRQCIPVGAVEPDKLRTSMLEFRQSSILENNLSSLAASPDENPIAYGR